MANTLGYANGISKVKVVLVGDSGVGKSSFVHLASHEEPLIKSSWTIGCSVEVKIHEYREGTSVQKPYFIEFWDVGGNNSHKNSRHVFFTPVHGIILVHDLTNRKSQQNLHGWLAEVLLRESGGPNWRAPLVDGFDAEQFGGFSQIPVLVVGSKVDQVPEYRPSNRLTTSTIARQCGADEMFINCLDKRSLAPGSSNAVKLSRFFDKVIERQIGAGRSDGGAHGFHPHAERESVALRKKSNYLINMPSL